MTSQGPPSALWVGLVLVCVAAIGLVCWAIYAAIHPTPAPNHGDTYRHPRGHPCRDCGRYFDEHKSDDDCAGWR